MTTLLMLGAAVVFIGAVGYLAACAGAAIRGMK
jgi:hypothetical protein